MDKYTNCKVKITNSEFLLRINDKQLHFQPKTQVNFKTSLVFFQNLQVFFETLLVFF